MDFTVVCPTEIVQFADKARQFRENGCEVLACSTDSQFSHMEYCKKERKAGGIGKVDIPLISDMSHTIAWSYGCLITKGPNSGTALRATYIIDPKGIVRHISINDLTVGRCPEEILRLVKAFQMTDKNGEVCPASWNTTMPTLNPQTDNVKTTEYFEKVMAKPTTSTTTRPWPHSII